MNPEIPTRTERTVQLVNGDTVLVRILNELQRDGAEKKAHRLALNECLPFARGGTEFPMLQAQIRQKSSEDQAKYLVQQDYSKFARDAESAFPIPNEPELGDKQPSDYAVAYAQWELDKREALNNQNAQIDLQYNQALARYLALKPRDRQRQCEDAYFGEQFTQEYVKAYVLEILLRAVRTEDNPLERYYPSAAAVEDAPDADRETVWNAYMEMDVKPDAIPTSPAE